MSGELPPPLPDDPRLRGLLGLVDGLLATGFGADVGSAGDQALARLRRDSQPRLAAVAPPTRTSARTRARRRAYRPAPLRGWAVAAVAASVLVALVVVARARADGPRATSAVTAAAPATILPDGSAISPAGDAEFTFEPEQRVVRLTSGRIAIEAMPQRADAPLRVVTPMLEATVVGTSFTVEHRADLSVVAVAHGRVRVRRGDSAIELGPGEATRALELAPLPDPNLSKAGLPPRGRLTIEPAPALAASEAATARSAAATPGLLAQYFDGADFARLRLSRIDPQVAFRWRPAPGPSDTPITDPAAQGVFSARWSGLVDAPVAGDYRFLVTGDDGARLWIDGRLAIDDWTIHKPRTASATLRLAAGAHALVLEYCQHLAHCQIALEWIPPGGTRALVPAQRLSHARVAGGP
ncbi:MAG TPA: PA14 domain-containing protein [Planctomycetota bacterium]|nr:PA14 domain-containing protein [Planctomycetota bacterium]